MTDEPVDVVGKLHPSAWVKLTFIGAPQCERCGIPFAFDPGAGTECAACRADPPVFGRARAPLIYDDVSRPLVLGFKHGGRRDGLALFAQWMAQAGADLLEDADLLVPIPLHRARLRKRRFNQAGLLAHALSLSARPRFAPDILARVRNSPSQAGRSANGRVKNVRGAFAVRSAAKPSLAGKRAVLVDDVYTTGATLSACARVLKRAGAAHVDALALARVARPRDATI